MNIINITDPDKITDLDNNTDSNTTLCDCTNVEYDINLTIPLLLFTIPCTLSFLCLISIMVYTLIIKPLFNKK